MLRWLCLVLVVVGCDSGGSALDAGPGGDRGPGADGSVDAEGADAGRDAAADAGDPGDVGLPEGPGPGLNGRVMGRVHGRFGPGPDDRVVLPGALVVAEAEDGSARSRPVTVDGEGRYELPPLPFGSWRVCARRAGFAEACHPDLVAVTAESPYAVRTFELSPEGAAVRGRLALADGTPCAFDQPAFGVRLRGQVAVAGAAPVEVDAQGGFFLAGLSAGPATVTGTCEAAQVAVSVDLLADEVASVPLELEGEAPTARALWLRSTEGQPIRRGRPGQAVDVVFDAVAEVPLTLRMIDGHGAPLALEDGAARMTLPAGSAQVLVLGLASDGRGGYAEVRAVFQVGDDVSRLGGRVLDRAGDPVAGATVTVDGQEAVTDDEGSFRLTAAGEGPFLVSVAAAGADHAVRVEPSSALRLVLAPLTRHAGLDVTRPHTLQDAGGRVALTLPAGAIPVVGRPPRGGATVELVGYDLTNADTIPGGGEAVDAAGEPLQVNLVAAASVTLTVGGRPVEQLAGRSFAELRFPAPPPAPGEERPASLTLLSLDPATQIWRAEGQATLDGDVYVARVRHFSVWSLGLAFDEEEACVRVDVPPEYLGQFVLRVSYQQGGFNGPVTAGSWVPTQTINVVRHLKPFTTISLEVRSLTDETQLLHYGTASARNPSFGGFIGYPYISGNFGCNGWYTVPRILPRALWLDRIKNSVEEAWDYYATLGYGPDLTLAQWKQQQGFTAADEAAAAAFYNPQEFGLGRRAVCHTTGTTAEDIEMACCVAKYGHVGGPEVEALEDTIHDTHVGDTVCMAWRPGPGGGERFAQFLAFKPDGSLSPTTVFDTSGAKVLPGVCGHCHGRTKNWADNGGDMGGRFVFFDVPAYRYAGWDATWTRVAQEERLRQLNERVWLVHGGQGPHAAYIDALYPQGVDTPGASAARPGPLPGWEGHPQTYVDVIRPNCRTCHIWQPEPFDFATIETVLGGMVRSYVCDGLMPNAMQPMLNIWSRLDPFLGDAITTAFQAEACFSDDAPPTVQILEPAAPIQIPVGGFMALRLRAAADDAEDGPGCCTLTWRSSRDGILGYGPELTTALASPGAHQITVTARDRRYRTGTDTVTVTAFNAPPVPRIRFPVMDNDSLFKGVPYLLLGDAADANLPLGLPCDGLTWTSSQAGDPFPQTGCHPEATFATNGPRTLTLRADDGVGGTAQVTRVINVPDPPLNAPPIVTILAPAPESGHDGEVAMQVRGSAVDPDQHGPMQWVFRAKPAFTPEASFVEIASGECAEGELCRPTFDWRPHDDLPRNCGGFSADLELRATDEHGTSQVRITFHVAYPPC